MAMLVGASNAAAQFAIPDTIPASKTPPTATTAAPAPAATAAARGAQFIQHARQAMAAKQYELAVRSYGAAAQLAQKEASLATDVARLRVDLQIAGIDQAHLAAAARPPQPMAPGINAQPIGTAPQTATPQTKKAETLRLLAIGRAALDRGDAATALRLGQQAKSLNVPESEFGPGEPRVWQFMLDAESAARRTGSMDSQIALAGGQREINGNEAGFIKQMLFIGDTNQGGVQQVQALGEPVADGLAAPATSDAFQMYQAGMAALKQGDKETARKNFVEAWKNESQLDLTIRAQLKDKLSLLQPTRLPSSTDTAGMSAIDKADLQAQEQTRRLYREITNELAKAAETKETAPLDTLDSLNRLRRKVDGATIEETSRQTLARMVDSELEKQKQYVEINRVKIEQELENEAIRTELATDAARTARIDEEISTLVDTFNDLIEERRFSEAEVVAKQVGELKPGSTIATNMFHLSRFASRDLQLREIQANREELFAEGLMDVERTGSNIDGMRDGQPLVMPDPRTWHDLSLRRTQDTGTLFGSVQEQQIKASLQNPISVQYSNRPLGEVIADLSALTGIPIVMNERAMAAINVTREMTVNYDVQTEIQLKSALNLILREFDLDYVIENDVLNITSAEAKRANTFTKVYKVADLVTPIPNFTTSYEDGLAGALLAAHQMTNPRMEVQMMPVSAMGIQNQANMLQPSKLGANMMGQYAPGGSQGGFGPQNPPSGMGGGGAFADFDSLMNLIQTTVEPDTWEALGGNSTMAPYQQNLSLIISTTSDVHDQIVDLIDSLRALQNLQITIEVRFITLADSFFEQIGVDFNVQFDDNVTQLPTDDEGPGVTIGFDAISGLPTPDLDITLENNSFGLAPSFGGFDAGAASSIGFAILSDIEAFFFLQAAQGDSRTNVMQAPKVTLFDGQIASISDQTQTPFVTSITPVVGDFAVAQQPVIVVLNEGTQLNVQGIVSADKRFVRLTLVPFFSQIGDVDTFTFEGSRTTTTSSRSNQVDTNGDGVITDSDQQDSDDISDVITGTTVQLPTFAFTQVSTTVSVPDGGTILLGGIKRLSEARAERGIPMLSKIPYLSRLFRNVSVGRDASSLMLMVTPRIIIQEEEEFAQTGFEPPGR